MSLYGAKEIIYIYNGNEAAADTQFDNDGMFPFPPDGSVLGRDGKEWSVVRTVMEAIGTKPKGLPLLKIYLVD